MLSLRVGLVVAGVLVANASVSAEPSAGGGPVIIRFEEPTGDADLDRIPRFRASDPEYEAFLNEYFLRHLSIDERGIYLGGGPVLFATDHMWVIDWDRFLFPWIDRGAMGTWRQGGSDVDVILTTLRNVPVSKFGHVWGGRLAPEPNDAFSHYIPLFGWPWPKFERNYTSDRPAGWNFNHLADGQRERWSAADLELDPGYVDHRLVGRVAGPRPRLSSPVFDTDAFQAPIVELDVEYELPEGTEGAADLVKDLRLLWQRGSDTDFTEDCAVDVSFSDLPPDDYPEVYAPYVTATRARYVLYFPMCLHPDWERGGTTIRRLRLDLGNLPEGTRVAVNYLRTAYDNRYSTNNAILIDATWRHYAWSGDRGFLAAQLPRMRRAMVFLNEHMRGREQALIDNSWFVGHHGYEGMRPGHSVTSGYWDLMPQGRYDLDACLYYRQALAAMARMERVASRYGLDASPVTVVGPDGHSELAYTCTADELEALAGRVKARIEDVFWNSETGRFGRSIDADGNLKDYGFLHMNVMALAFGVGTETQRRSILDWLDDVRRVEGDTALGQDIYHWRFGPRTTTRRNTDYYYWAWIWERDRDPANPQFAWGNQMQDGGGVPFTSFFELIARTRAGQRSEVDRAFERTRAIQDWFRDVKAAGGEGRDFYRAYYGGHPERGLQQSPSAGGLGLDREFLSDAALGTAFLPAAFLGADAPEDGLLQLAPCVPSELESIGMDNLFYRGHHLRVRAERGVVLLAGDRFPAADGLELRVILPAGAELRQVLGPEGKDLVLYRTETVGDRTAVRTPLGPVEVRWREMGSDGD
jgi:hypothetical protein